MQKFFLQVPSELEGMISMLENEGNKSGGISLEYRRGFLSYYGYSKKMDLVSFVVVQL